MGPFFSARVTSLRTGGLSSEPGEPSSSSSLSRSRLWPPCPLPSGPLVSSSLFCELLAAVLQLWCWRASPRHVPQSIPQEVKSTCVAASLSLRVFMVSICFRASYWLDCCHGFLTAMICFDLVIKEQRPFGAPKFLIWWW